MQIVQAVFGVFHHFELAHQLERRGHLRRIYSSWPWARLKREGVPREFVSPFPWLQGTDQILHRTGLNTPLISRKLNRWNTLLFDEYMAATIPACDAYIAISGAGLKTGRRVQARGGKFLCDRGSTHQRFQENLLREEYARWKVPLPAPTPYIAQREEEIYATADGVTVPSSVARRSFITWGLPPGKVHVIPYGVRLDRFVKNGDVPTDSFEVLFAGHVSLRKGVPYLLQAFARLNHPRKHLTVVGPMQDDIKPVLATLPTDAVTFTGAVPQTELIGRMSQSHVMVLPSIEEGLALVQAQAMACGCPVIATEATGAEDLFSNDAEGFIVPDRDVDALSTRLQQVADDAALRERLASAAIRRVQTIGGWDTYGARWDDLLHTLTGCPRETN
jgi:starch synthase